MWLLIRLGAWQRFGKRSHALAFISRGAHQSNGYAVGEGGNQSLGEIRGVVDHRVHEFVEGARRSRNSVASKRTTEARDLSPTPRP